MASPTTREHLLQIGLRSIHANGYTATGVKEILDRAGVPKGSFYHYFPSKEAFTQEVLQLYAATEGQRCERILGDQKLPPLRRLRRYFEELISAFGQQALISGCLAGNLSLEVAPHSPVLQPLLSSFFGIWQQAIAQVLRAAVERGDLPASSRPNVLAAFLINGWERLAAFQSREERPAA